MAFHDVNFSNTDNENAFICFSLTHAPNKYIFSN